MQRIRKVGLITIIMTLIFSSISSPVFATVGNKEGIDETFNETARINSDEDVPLFADNTSSGDILATLKPDTEVVVLEFNSEFSLIEYTEEANDQEPIIWEGYINSSFLDFQTLEDQSDPDDIDESFSDDENISSDRDSNPTLDETNEPDSSLENEKDNEDSLSSESNDSSSISQQTLNHNQQTYYGIALKNETHVYNQTKRSNILKSYAEGSILKYRSYNNSWYEASVYIEHEWITGYIHKSDVEGITETQETLYGIGLKDPTPIYTKASKNASVHKSYSEGAILKYRTFTKDWYEATVKVGDHWKTGYIHKSHVENKVTDQQTLLGIGLKNPTHVYTKASTASGSHKSYPEGSILKYRTFTKDWYEATVYVNGKRKTGYIHKNHVENKTEKQQTLNGIGIKNPTHIYTQASTKAKVHKSYPQGSILKYKTFTKDWYEATVYVNGKRKTGYIHKNHVENKIEEQKTLNGIGVKNPTHIYTRASTSASIYKSYPHGSILKYKTFTKDWYEATVYVNGKRKTGYIHKTHVEQKVDEQESRFGVALKSPTRVYTRASTNANTYKSYKQGHILQYKTFTSNWYEARVKVDGNWQTGYIHKNHVGTPSNQKTSEGFAQKEITHVYEKPFRNSKSLKSYEKRSILKYKTYANNWYEARVSVNGQWLTGYIHANDVSSESNTKYDYDFKQMVDIQMKRTPKSDGAGIIPATRGEVEFYANPANFQVSSMEYFQFLILSEPAGLNAKEINQSILNGRGVLDGMAQAFINAGKKYNINEAYLISHALHETGNGNSVLASGVPVDANGDVTRDKKGNIAETSKTKETVYNMYGYGAHDECPIECGAKYAFQQKWFDIEASIVGGAGRIVDYINRGQDTLYKMRWNPTSPGHPQYATHVQWATLQTKRLYDIYQQIDEYSALFDVPAFNNLPNYSKATFGTTTAKNGLRIRTGPGTSYGINSSIPNNTKIQIIGSNPNGWYNVKYNNTKGWVSAAYVNLIY